MRIVVIGSGFGGLAAAIRLQALGHDVTICEKLDQAGGRAYVFRQDGFTFDAGPTIITAPWPVDGVFEAAGKRREAYVDLVQLDPFYNVRFEDGAVFRYNGNRDDLAEQVRRFSPGDVDGYRRFVEAAHDVFDCGMPLIDRPLHSVGRMLAVAPDLVRLRADRSVAGMVNRYLKDPRLRQVFSFHPLLIGGNPFKASAMFALIHYLEQKWGVWFAKGGMGALVQALVRCFEDIGGEIRYDAEVAEVTLDATRTRATGVRLASGAALPADTVVCNAETATAMRRMVPEAARPRLSDAKLTGYRYSNSLFLVYFGTNRQYPQMAHHEILLGPRYKELLRDIFDRRVLADDFSLYLHRPTATDPTLAPPGHDCWYVLSPVPHLGANIDWQVEGPRYRDRILAHLEARYGKIVADLIGPEPHPRRARVVPLAPPRTVEAAVTTGA
ncbi:MAG: phytoene desaturase [Gemmatimonadetes bacterium]|nr:phytoene desaturase [Gemmatimonadota bacterium]